MILRKVKAFLRLAHQASRQELPSKINKQEHALRKYRGEEEAVTDNETARRRWTSKSHASQ